MSKIPKILMVVILSGLAMLVQAGQYDQTFNLVLQMMKQSAKNNEAGVEKARQQLERIPALPKRNVREARALNQRGLEAMKRGDVLTAETAFKQAQKENPADPEISGNLGYVNFKMGQFKRARVQLVYTLSLSPTRSASWYNLGQVYGGLEDVENATGAFANAYRYSPKRARTVTAMQRALSSTESDKTTRTALKRVLEQFGLPLKNS